MKNKCYQLVLLSAILIMAQITRINAQNLQCGSTEYMQKQFAAHPELRQKQMDYDNSITEMVNRMKLEKSVDQQFIIPVVFHIIHTNGTENITDAQVYNAMWLINRDWNKRNGDTIDITPYTPFDSLAAAMHFTFRLATIDPNGNCTNGIERIYSHLTNNADDQAKLNPWPSDKYLNIWIVKQIAGTAAAYSTIPGMSFPWSDGIICDYNYTGDTLQASPLSQHVLPHEIGHFFNLEHPWGNNNNADVACGDDGVDDTPFTRGHLTCDVTPHCTRDTVKYTYDFNSITTSSGIQDTAHAPTNDFLTLGQFSAVGVSSNPIESARFSYTNWPTGAINGTVISMTVDTNSVGYNIGDTFTPIGGTPTTASVGTVSSLQVISATMTSPGTSLYAPGQLLTLATGTGTRAIISVITTKVVGMPFLVNPGSGYQAGDTLNPAHGAGIKARIIIDGVNGSGAILTYHLDAAGSYITNPTVTNDTVTGGHGITRARFNFKMGIDNFNLSSGGNYTVIPTLVGDSATGTGVGARWDLVMGVKNISVTVGGIYTLSPSNFPTTISGSSTATLTGTGTGLKVKFVLGPLTTGVIDPSKYYQVKVISKWGNSMTPTRINFDISRNLTGIRSFAVRSSADNYANNLPASINANSNLGLLGTNEFFYNSDTTLNQSGSQITLSGNPFKNIDSITFRFYGWNAEDLTGSFSIDNVKLTDTAGLIEDYQNIMDYSYAAGTLCNNHFTKGQKLRVRAAAMSTASFRNSLWINSNLVATGTADPYPSGIVCNPTPDFFANRMEICAGSNVTFTATNSTNVTQGTTPTKSWSFDIGSGTPIVSTLASPVITYPNAGDFDVTLTLNNGTATGTTTKHSFIHVSQAWPQYNSNAVENFENSSSYYWNWIIDNPDNNSNGWAYSGAAGYSGTHSMLMYAFNDYPGDLDDFITPGYNLSFLSSPILTFRCAAASSATALADLNDVLTVYYSKDCGQTWFPAGGLSGATLNNNGYSANSFIPTSQSQWLLRSFTLPANIAVGNVKFKFEYKTGNKSNNIYIDDINITGTLGIQESAIDNATVSLYPNPSNNVTTLFYHLNTKGNVKIEVVDVLGKKVMEMDNKNQIEGDYNYSISKLDNNLKSGIYFVRFTLDGNTISKKIIFTE